MSLSPHARLGPHEIIATSLSPGTRIGHYEIVSALGAGGMGEVYRARDPKLGREVAIKILPAAMAQDPERLARFKREAQVLASLNHPNIAHVHGFEAATLSDGSTVHFLAMEMVEGEDLSERLQRGLTLVRSEDAQPAKAGDAAFHSASGEDSLRAVGGHAGDLPGWNDGGVHRERGSVSEALGAIAGYSGR